MHTFRCRLRVVVKRFRVSQANTEVVPESALELDVTLNWRFASLSIHSCDQAIAAKSEPTDRRCAGAKVAV